MSVDYKVALVGEKLKHLTEGNNYLFFPYLKDYFKYVDDNRICLEKLVTFIYADDRANIDRIIKDINEFFSYFFIITPSVCVVGEKALSDDTADLLTNFDYVVLWELEISNIEKIAKFVYEKKSRELERKKLELLNHAVVLDLYEELKRESLAEKPLFYYGVDHNGILKTVDDRVLDILGFSKDEILGKHFTELIATEELERVSRAFNERRTGDRGTRGVMVKFKRKDGTYREFIVDTQGVHIPTIWEYPSKEPHRLYIGTFGRINEVRRDSRNKVDVFNNTNEPVFIYNETRKHLLINKGAENFLGYSNNEVKEKDPSFFEKEGYEYFSKAKNRLKEDSHITYTTIIKRKDGSDVDCEVSIDKINMDGDYYYIGIYRDISDYIRFIDQADSLIQITWLMINSKTREELVTKAAGHIIKILNIKYLIISLWSNKKKGFDLIYLQKSDRGSLLKSEEDERAEKFIEIMKETLGQDTTRYIELEKPLCGYFGEKLGEREKDIKNFVSIPLKVGDEKLGVMGIFLLEDEFFTLRDIRMIELSSNVLSSGIYRYNLESRLVKNLESLEKMVKERTKELEDFIYIVSHDLKTPLYAAKSFSEIVAEQFGKFIKNDEDRYIVRRIGENIDNAIKMINDLLTLSRVGTRELRFERINLRELIDDYLLQYNAIKKSDVSLNIIFEGDVQHIYGDRGRITQLFTNLFDNSIKYRRENNVIIKVKTSMSGGNVRIVVEDNGIGIDEDEIDKIFKVFYRGSKARTRELEGSGCGLSIVKKIVEIHRGSLRVESKPGEGTRFIIELPVNND